MNKKLAATFVGIGAVLSASWAVAQEQTAPEQQNQTASKQWAKGAAEQQQEQPASQTQEMPPQQVTDGGVEAVREAQDMKIPPASKKFKNAKAVLTAKVKEKRWKNGWDSKKKRFITVESAEFDVADPASDRNFLVLRDAAIKRAILQAKAKIIEFCNTRMDAMDMVYTPGTPLNEEFDKDVKAIEATLVMQKEEVAKLLAKYNRAEADVLRGTTISDRLDDLIAAMIKKLDDTYKASARDEKAAKKLEEAKRNLEVAKKRIAELEKKAKALKGKLARRQTSGIKTFASMPLYGATGLMQTESWDGKRYQVAIVMCWSNALERSARAIASGETNFKLKAKPNGKDIDGWLESQNLATMVGPRQFVDKDGTRWFIGIAARSYDDDLNEIVRDKNKEAAEMAARSSMAFSVWGDVEAYRLAQQEVRTMTHGEDAVVNKVAENIEKKLSQSIQNKIVRGMQPIASEEVEHPISGRTIYVSVYAINPAAAEAAATIEALNVATKIMDNRHQTVERGRAAANKTQIEASKNRPEDFQKGYNKQTKRINRELNRRTPAQRKGTNMIQQPASKTSKKAQSTSGTFSGDSDVDENDI